MEFKRLRGTDLYRFEPNIGGEYQFMPTMLELTVYACGEHLLQPVEKEELSSSYAWPLWARSGPSLIRLPTLTHG